MFTNIILRFFFQVPYFVWLKIHEIEQLWGVLEPSGPPLGDGHGHAIYNDVVSSYSCNHFIDIVFKDRNKASQNKISSFCTSYASAHGSTNYLFILLKS